MFVTCLENAKIVVKYSQGNSTSGQTMLLYDLSYLKYLCGGILIFSLLASLCTAYAYSVNSRRSSEDPEKRNYRLGHLFLVFFTWPFLLLGFISLWLLRALLYALSFIFFILYLILSPRELPGPLWIEKMIIKTGDNLLRANSFLLKLVMRPWVNKA